MVSSKLVPELIKINGLFTPALISRVVKCVNTRTYCVRVFHAIIIYCGCDTNGFMVPELCGIDGAIRVIRIDIPDMVDLDVVTVKLNWLWL